MAIKLITSIEAQTELQAARRKLEAEISWGTSKSEISKAIDELIVQAQLAVLAVIPGE